MSKELDSHLLNLKKHQDDLKRILTDLMKSHNLNNVNANDVIATAQSLTTSNDLSNRLKTVMSSFGQTQTKHIELMTDIQQRDQLIVSIKSQVNSTDKPPRITDPYLLSKSKQELQDMNELIGKTKEKRNSSAHIGQVIGKRIAFNKFFGGNDLAANLSICGNTDCNTYMTGIIDRGKLFSDESKLTDAAFEAALNGLALGQNHDDEIKTIDVALKQAAAAAHKLPQGELGAKLFMKAQELIAQEKKRNIILSIDDAVGKVFKTYNVIKEHLDSESKKLNVQIKKLDADRKILREHLGKLTLLVSQDNDNYGVKEQIQKLHTKIVESEKRITELNAALKIKHPSDEKILADAEKLVKRDGKKIIAGLKLDDPTADKAAVDKAAADVLAAITEQLFNTQPYSHTEGEQIGNILLGGLDSAIDIRFQTWLDDPTRTTNDVDISDFTGKIQNVVGETKPILDKIRKARIDASNTFVSNQSAALDSSIKKNKERQKILRASELYNKTIQAGILEAECVKLEAARAKLQKEIITPEHADRLLGPGLDIDKYPFVPDTHTGVRIGKIFQNFKKDLSIKNWLESESVDLNLRTELKQILETDTALTTDQQLRLDMLYNMMLDSLGTTTDGSAYTRQWTNNCFMSLGRGDECSMSALKTSNETILNQSEDRAVEIEHQEMIAAASLAATVLSSMPFAWNPVAAVGMTYVRQGIAFINFAHVAYQKFQDIGRISSGIKETAALFEKTIWGEYRGIAGNLDMDPNDIVAAEALHISSAHKAVLGVIDVTTRISGVASSLAGKLDRIKFNPFESGKTIADNKKKYSPYEPSTWEPWDILSAAFLPKYTNGSIKKIDTSEVTSMLKSFVDTGKALGGMTDIAYNSINGGVDEELWKQAGENLWWYQSKDLQPYEYAKLLAGKLDNVGGFGGNGGNEIGFSGRSLAMSKATADAQSSYIGSGKPPNLWSHIMMSGTRDAYIERLIPEFNNRLFNRIYPWDASMTKYGKKVLDYYKDILDTENLDPAKLPADYFVTKKLTLHDIIRNATDEQSYLDKLKTLLGWGDLAKWRAAAAHDAIVFADANANGLYDAGLQDRLTRFTVTNLKNVAKGLFDVALAAASLASTLDMGAFTSGVEQAVKPIMDYVQPIVGAASNFVAPVFQAIGSVSTASLLRIKDILSSNFLGTKMLDGIIGATKGIKSLSKGIVVVSKLGMILANKFAALKTRSSTTKGMRVLLFDNIPDAGSSDKDDNNKGKPRYQAPLESYELYWEIAEISVQLIAETLLDFAFHNDDYSAFQSPTSTSSLNGMLLRSGKQLAGVL
jgi:hypothetical protein